MEAKEKKKSSLGTLGNVLDELILTFKHPSVEPVIFLVFLGWTFGSTLQSTGVYRKICELHYGERMDCEKITDVSAEDDVQERNVDWSLATAFAYFFPAIIADTTLGAYGDRNGRKVVIMLGLIGITISEFGYLLVLSRKTDAPFWIILICNLLSGFTGYITMIPAACNAYLSDTSLNTDILTLRAGIFSMFQSMASVIGAIVAGFVHEIKVEYAIDTELALFLITMFYVLWRIPQKPGLEEIQRCYSIGGQKEMFIVKLKEMLKNGFQTYKKRREGNRRAFIFLSVIVLMFSYTITIETRTDIVMNSYVFRRVDNDSLDWNNQDLGFWNGVGYGITMIGTLVGLYIFKQLLGLRETAIVIIGLVSSAARTVMIGLAQKWWYMYIASVCGLFTGLIQPAIVSFIVQLVDEEEVGRVFALFGVGNDLAYVISYLLYGNVYRVTQSWCPGFLFFFIAGIEGLLAFAVLWMHFQSIREKIGKEEKEIKTNIRKVCIYYF